MPYKALDKSIKTGEVRLSYAHLLEPRRADEDSEPKYSVVLMIPKGTEQGEATITKLRSAQKEALALGKDSIFGGRIPKDWDTIHDGDDEDETDLDRNPQYAGHWYLSVNTGAKYPPSVIDRRGNLLTSPEDVYSGMWARVSVSCFAYANPKKKGVTFGLNSILKTRDDERFAGGRSAASEWADDLDDVEDDFDDADDVSSLL